MAITTGPQIDMNQIHVEAGGGSGTQHSLNDTDIRALISKGSGVQMAMTEWYGATSAAAIVATGGTITDSGGYRYHTFTSSGTFTVSSIASGSFSNTLEFLVVGGGGAGGATGGGGGAGGTCIASTRTATVKGHSVTVGGGMAGTSANTSNGPGVDGSGGTSIFDGTSATGGQSGGSRFGVTTGAANASYTGGAGLANNNPDFGWGGGGAGGGQLGSPQTSSGGKGGDGYTWLNGSTYAGGGGGGVFALPSAAGAGGTGGGGAGGTNNVGAAANGAYYGAGGGGGGYVFWQSGSGHAGIVIVRYEI